MGYRAAVVRQVELLEQGEDMALGGGWVVVRLKSDEIRYRIVDRLLNQSNHLTADGLVARWLEQR